jgi:hypothetical protein
MSVSAQYDSLGDLMRPHRITAERKCLDDLRVKSSWVRRLVAFLNPRTKLRALCVEPPNTFLERTLRPPIPAPLPAEAA